MGIFKKIIILILIILMIPVSTDAHEKKFLIKSKATINQEYSPANVPSEVKFILDKDITLTYNSIIPKGSTIYAQTYQYQKRKSRKIKS